jgi:hypothetical protein
MREELSLVGLRTSGCGACSVCLASRHPTALHGRGRAGTEDLPGNCADIGTRPKYWKVRYAESRRQQPHGARVSNTLR